MRSARDNLKFLDDLAKVATGAIGSFSEVRHQVRNLVKERVDQLMGQMDMVSREEFERVEAVAERARLRQEELEKRLTALERQLKPTSKRKKK
ncbi:MAG: accessory factor UbiK family protein [Alphaproteobacteria bacterium]|nr:MAG: accessory factor UbiK family protein [Alphaproteobacteria bacterium]